MSTVRMFASDLDGTLLRSDGTVSQRTREALQAAEDAGIVVAFVTGRPPRWLHEVADQTGHTGVAVAANGAVIYDLAAEEIVRTQCIAPEEVLAIADELRAAFPEAGFAVEFGMRFASEPGYLHHWDINPPTLPSGRRIPPPVIGELREFVTEPAVKLLARDSAADPDEFLHAAATLLTGRASVTHSSSHGLLEISAPGVTKASGLAHVAESHGIPAADVAAVGDMPNDIPMLEWAGRSYAVANAHPAAKAVAGRIVAANDADGVALLVEELLAAHRRMRASPA